MDQVLLDFHRIFEPQMTTLSYQRCVAAILSTYFCPAAVEDPKYAYTEDGLYAPPAPGPMQATRECGPLNDFR